MKHLPQEIIDLVHRAILLRKQEGATMSGLSEDLRTERSVIAEILRTGLAAGTIRTGANMRLWLSKAEALRINARPRTTHPDVRRMIEFPATAEAARDFIRDMEAQGYDAVTSGPETRFKRNDRIDGDHVVRIDGDVATIGVRPA